MIATKSFKPFKRRIRLLFCLEGLGLGLFAAAVIGLVWGLLDWRGIVYLEWSQLVLLLVIGGALGAGSGFLRRVDDLSVARSIDRRAKLKDRIGTTLTNDEPEGLFTQDLADDAAKHLSEIRAKTIYPVRPKRIHSLALLGAGLAVLVLFLSNTRIFLPQAALAEKEAMSKEAKRLEQLRKAIFDDPTDKESTSPELMALQKDLQKLQKDYEKAKIDPKEAMLKAEELAKKAEELAKKSAEQSLDNIKQAESMMEKMERAELQKAGLEKADLESAKMSDTDFNRKMDATQQKSEDTKNKVEQLNSKLDSLKAQLNKPGLDENAKKDLQEKIKQTEKELQDAMKAAQQAQKDMEAMQLSKEARDVLKKIYDDPIWKQIQEEAAKLKANAQQGAQTGQPKLSKEERQKLQKEMEELLKKLSDDDFRKEYLQKLLEAIKKGCGT